MTTINRLHITQTEAYSQLENTIFVKNEYQKLKNYYHKKFKNYACEGDTTNLNKDIDNLFSKTNGIPFIFSHITFENSNNSIYTNPKKVESDLYHLKQKYFNKFNYHIQHLNPTGVSKNFLKLYSDLEKIPRNYLKWD
ncbi:hypothetical protein ACVRXF_10395 [Streptococcus orisasini]